MSERFTDRLRRKADNIMDAQHQHPFVTGIGDGTLDVEKFKNKYQLTPEQLKKTKMTAEDIEIAQKILLAIEDMFLLNIADWSLEESFNLYDEKEDLIYRFFNFSKGMTKNYLVINSEPQIELISNEMDNQLLLHISNILLDFVIACVRS